MNTHVRSRTWTVMYVHVHEQSCMFTYMNSHVRSHTWTVMYVHVHEPSCTFTYINSHGRSRTWTVMYVHVHERTCICRYGMYEYVNVDTWSEGKPRKITVCFAVIRIETKLIEAKQSKMKQITKRNYETWPLVSLRFQMKRKNLCETKRNETNYKAKVRKIIVCFASL